MLMLVIVILGLTLGYVLLILLYKYGWHSQPYSYPAKGLKPSTKVSVIIPARNEAKNIGNCIRSIMSNNYPTELLEIIVMDDHSTDGTDQIVEEFGKDNIRCLRLQDFLEDGEQLNSYKKKAIETAIGNSSGSLMVTTDADCIVPERWLYNLVALFEDKKPVMMVAPVSFISGNTLLETFQSLDFMTMQGITAAAHRLRLGNMSNGANLAFSKKAFYEVGGYKEIDHLASGDDFLLMGKFQKNYPEGVVYLKTKEAIVQTLPQPDWKGFFQQRIRWASKSGKYDDHKLTSVLALVYLFNFSFLLMFLFGFWRPEVWKLALGILMLKLVIELFFLYPVAGFFNKKKELLWFPFLQPLHIIYIISSGFMGFLGGYQWKGRKVN
jgi:cellulose synthase/poly-beta-1,6-N-acetylglucosamine synthase-like glycosyltransferase